MKAMLISEERLPTIAREVTRGYLRDIKRRLEIAKKLEIKIFYVPYYMYPETAGIRREFITSDDFLNEHFFLTDWNPITGWMTLEPRRCAESYSKAS